MDRSATVRAHATLAAADVVTHLAELADGLVDVADTPEREPEVVARPRARDVEGLHARTTGARTPHGRRTDVPVAGD